MISGTNNTATNNLLTSNSEFNIVSSRDVCLIIKTASQYNVAELEFGPLRVVFTRVPSYSPLEQPVTESNQSEGNGLSFAVSGHKAHLPLNDDSELLEAIRTTQLAIDDPMAFEQEMADGFLQQGIEDGETRNSRPKQALSRS